MPNVSRLVSLNLSKIQLLNGFADVREDVEEVIQEAIQNVESPATRSRERSIPPISCATADRFRFRYRRDAVLRAKVIMRVYDFGGNPNQVTHRHRDGATDCA
jgi:hypothetical protein